MRRTAAPTPTRALSAKTFGVLAVVGLVVAFSLSSTLVKRAESPGVLVAFWRMVTVSVVWNLLLLSTGRRITMRDVRQVFVPGDFFGLNLAVFFAGATHNSAAVQWWAAKGALGRPAAWISSSAAAYAAGLAAGAALVSYDTDLGSLALMGLVSGAALGAAQGLVLAQQGDRRLGAAWGAAMPVLFALAWVPTTVIGVSVENQFTVFGAAGAILFMLLSGLLLARFTPSSARVA